MQLKIAKTAGFCFGVSRAIKMAEEAIEKYKDKKLYSLGPIIHNKQVVSEYEKKGIKIIEDISEIDNDTVLIIRAHGVPESVYKQAKGKNLILVDTTCPFVKKIHNKVSECTQKEYKPIIVGDRNHPEVIGIKGWNEDATIIGSEEEAEMLNLTGKVCVVAQTTLVKEKWDKVCRIINNKISDCEIFNTICNATSERQEEAQEIAKSVDIMLVIGDPNSSNSQKLYQICKNQIEKTYFIENAGQINLDWFKIKNKNDLSVGITAGASTPEHIIKEAIIRMSEIGKTVEDELSFKEMFEGSIKRIEQGEVLKGKIISITSKEVFVDLGYKADGVIPNDEYSDNPDEKPSDTYKAGDEIEVYVIKINDGEGNILLSRKRIEYLKGWEKVETAFNNQETVNGIASEVVKGGVIVLVSGVRVFVPGSQLSDRFAADMNQYLKKPISLKIIDFDRQKKKIIGSHKVIMQKEREIAKKSLLQTIEVGQVVKGTVKRLVDFGAFVDLGGMDGLIHISELSWNRIKHPSEVLKEGQEVEVRIIEIDREKEKISLGYRKTVDNPWKNFISEYEVGKVISGKVVNMMPFGAFVEIEPGVTGLVHISQISSRRINKPQEVLQLGQEVEAKITEIDLEKKKISLSIKEILPIVDEKVQKSDDEQDKNNQEVSAEHHEDLNLTLGDLMDKTSDNTALVTKGESSLEKVEPKPLTVIEKDAEKKEEK